MIYKPIFVNNMADVGTYYLVVTITIIPHGYKQIKLTFIRRKSNEYSSLNTYFNRKLDRVETDFWKQL